jgi:hypothetical protein
MTGNISILAAALLAVLTLFGAAARLWIKSYIESLARAIVERDLEGFKSELRQQEASLNSLQSALLSGRAARSALVDKRHLEAAEAIWRDVVRLRGAGMAVMMMKMLKLAEVNQKAVRDTKMREFLTMARGRLEINDIVSDEVDHHQPFVGPVLWAKFSALRAVYLHAVVTLDGMSKGIDDLQKIMSDNSKLNDMLKEALPHQEKYLEDNPKVGAFHLTGQLSDAVLRAVQDEIEGVQADADAVRRAGHIIGLASDLERNRQASVVNSR